MEVDKDIEEGASNSVPTLAIGWWIVNPVVHLTFSLLAEYSSSLFSVFNWSQVNKLSPNSFLRDSILKMLDGSL